MRKPTENQALFWHFFQKYVTFIYKQGKTANKGVRKMPQKDRNAWKWGFTVEAENWNGRIAMLGFLAALLIELISGEGLLHLANSLLSIL